MGRLFRAPFFMFGARKAILLKVFVDSDFQKINYTNWCCFWKIVDFSSF